MGHKKKIVIWGTGTIARKFYYEKCYQYDVQYFIDNYEPQYIMHNLKTYSPQEIDLKKYKIIIAIADWKIIAKQLEECGLFFYKDYLPYQLLDKDEIPIMDILRMITEYEDKYDAMCDYAGDRKIALINGNCQTSRIKMYLKQNIDFNKEYVFLDVPALHTLSKDDIELMMKNRYIFKEIKLFITQNISLNNAFDSRLSNEWLIEFMSEDVKYIRITNLFFDIYFPQSGKEQDPVREEFIRNMFPYNDAIIDELSNKPGFTGGGYTVEEIIQIVKLDNLFTDNFLSWIIEYRIEQLNKRESECDIRMMDYIEDNYLKEQLFYSRNHPINKVLKEESIRILQHINSEWDITIEHEETIPSLSINQEFIYPSVAQKLKLDFDKKYYSDALSECKYAIEDEIEKYLFCCKNK